MAATFTLRAGAAQPADPRSPGDDSVALAETPARGPAGTTQPADVANHSARAGDGLNGRLITRPDAPSPAEWQAVRHFMQQHSPVRMSFIEALPDAQRRHEAVARMVREYNNFQRAADDDQLQQVMLHRFELEDHIFDLTRQLHQGTLQQQAEVKHQLHEAVAEWTDANLQERQLRIDRLRHTVMAQQNALDRDNTDREALIERFYEQLLWRGQKNMPFQPLQPARRAMPTSRPTTQP